MPNTFAQLGGILFRVRHPVSPLPDRAAASVSPHRGGLLSLADIVLCAESSVLNNNGTFIVEIDPIAIDNPFTHANWSPGGYRPDGYNDLKYMICAFRFDTIGAAGGDLSMNDVIAVAWSYSGGNSVSFDIRSNDGSTMSSISKLSSDGPDSGVAFPSDHYWDETDNIYSVVVTSGDPSSVYYRFIRMPLGGLISNIVPEGWMHTDRGNIGDAIEDGIHALISSPPRMISDDFAYIRMTSQDSINSWYNNRDISSRSASGLHSSGMAIPSMAFDVAYVNEGLGEWNPGITFRAMQRVIVDGLDKINLSIPRDNGNGFRSSLVQAITNLSSNSGPSISGVGGYGKWIPGRDDGAIQPTLRTSIGTLSGYNTQDPLEYGPDLINAYPSYYGMGNYVMSLNKVIVAIFGNSMSVNIKVFDLDEESVIHDVDVYHSAWTSFHVIEVPPVGSPDLRRVRAFVYTRGQFPLSHHSYAWPMPEFFPPTFDVVHVNGSVIRGAINESYLINPPSSHNDFLRVDLVGASAHADLAGFSYSKRAIVTWTGLTDGWYKFALSRSLAGTSYSGANCFITYDSGARLTNGAPLVLVTGPLFYTGETITASISEVTPSVIALSLGDNSPLAISSGYLWLSFTAASDGLHSFAIWDAGAGTDEIPEVFVGSDGTFRTWEGEPIGRGQTGWQPAPAPSSLLAAPPSIPYGIYAVASGATGPWTGQDGNLAIGGGSGADSWTFVKPQPGDWTTTKPRKRWNGSAWVAANRVQFSRPMQAGETVYMRVAGRWMGNADPNEGRSVTGGGWHALVAVA